MAKNQKLWLTSAFFGKNKGHARRDNKAIVLTFQA